MRTLKKRQHKLADKDLAAQDAILDDLFYDIYRNRGRVYRMNFFRGIFFGLGTVIGGTIIIAIVIWVLSLLVDIPGGIGDFISWIIDTIQNR